MCVCVLCGAQADSCTFCLLIALELSSLHPDILPPWCTLSRREFAITAVEGCKMQHGGAPYSCSAVPRPWPVPSWSSYLLKSMDALWKRCSVRAEGSIGPSDKSVVPETWGSVTISLTGSPRPAAHSSSFKWGVGGPESSSQWSEYVLEV